MKCFLLNLEIDEEITDFRELFQWDDGAGRQNAVGRELSET